MNRPILCLAGDAGGAAALAPVIAALQARGTPLRLLAYGPAATQWAARGWRVAAPELAPSAQAADCAGAALVLTATSCNTLNAERAYWQAAFSLGIPALAVLDYWSNYGARFQIEGAAFWPDRIAVMDRVAAEALRAAGCPDERLAITGHAAFDALRQDLLPSPQRRRLRERLGVPDDRVLAVFVSQPLSELHHLLGQGAGASDEWRILAMVIEAIDDGTSPPAHLVIRPHPREPEGKYAPLVRALPPVTVDSSAPAHALVQAADLVLGIHSMLLLEACCLGCPVLSLQPGLWPEPAAAHDPLPSNRLGASLALYTPDAVIPEIRRHLRQPAAREDLRAHAPRALPEPGAVGRTLRLIDSMVVR